MPDKTTKTDDTRAQKRRARKPEDSDDIAPPAEPARVFERAPPPAPGTLPGLRSPIAGSPSPLLAKPPATPPRPAPSASPRMVNLEVKTMLFDPVYYLTNNPDVASSGTDPVTHYLSFGWNEGRDPNPYFDSAYYLRSNPDVVTQGLNPFLHFLLYGAREGRSPKG